MFRIGKCLLPDILKEKGLNQQYVADRLDMKRAQVSDYCRNKKKMSYITALNIAHVVGCRQEELYELIPVPRSQRKRSRRKQE